MQKSKLRVKTYETRHISADEKACSIKKKITVKVQTEAYFKESTVIDLFTIEFLQVLKFIYLHVLVALFFLFET